MFEFSNGLVGSPRISVYDHTKLQDHLESIGISLEEINFFTWRALPDKSYGRFLVYEKQWIESGIQSVQNPDAPIYLHIKSRTPSDTEISKAFGVDVTGTAFIMSPNQKTTEEIPPENEGDPPQIINHGQDGERLLIIEVELIRGYTYGDIEYYHKANPLVLSHSSFDSLRNMFDNSELLSVVPEVLNRYEFQSIRLIEYLAYIASTHFLTVYISNLNGKATLTDQLFEYPDPADNPMLYNKVITRQYPPEIKVRLKSDNHCSPDIYESDNLDLNWGIGEDVAEDYFYQSPVAYNTDTPKWYTEIPFAMVDHIKAESDPNHGKNEANRFAEQIQEYASTRLLRDVDIVYQGLVLSPLANDVQNITYYFQGYDGGIRTRIRSIPWEIPSYLPWLKNLIGSERIYKGYLLTNISPGSGDVQGHTTGKAVILSMSNEYLIDISKTVYEDTSIFENLKTGMTVLLYRESSDCVFNIIQSECPPDTTPSTTQGKCCVELSIQNGPTRNYCINTTQLVCQKLGGTWTSGQTCNGNPYCE